MLSNVEKKILIFVKQTIPIKCNICGEENSYASSLMSTK